MDFYVAGRDMRARGGAVTTGQEFKDKFPFRPALVCCNLETFSSVCILIRIGYRGKKGNRKHWVNIKVFSFLLKYVET